MSRHMTKRNVQRLALCGLAVVLGSVIASDAQALHRRRMVVVYGAAPIPPLYAGPSSFNPVGFGFGGYSYGGYPYYGYYGNLPGPYAGFSGYGPGPGIGPVYGPASYDPYAASAATGLDAVPAPACAAPGCEIAAPGCEPACLMTPCQYRRYVRRLNRALAHGLLCAPLAAPCAYGAVLGTDAMLGAGEELDAVEGDGSPTIEFTPNAPAPEQVAPPAGNVPGDEAPRPSLESSSF